MGTRRSRHNKGRKPVYKDYRTTIVVPASHRRENANSFLTCELAKSLNINDVMKLGEAQAIDLFRQIRWIDSEGTPECHECGSLKTYALSNRPMGSRCAKCASDISWTARTIFSGHKQPATILLASIAYFNSPNNVPRSVQAAKKLGINYRSAWLLSKKMRHSLSNAPTDSIELGRSRYVDGLLLSTRTHWSKPETEALERFAREEIDIEVVSKALGRTPKSVAYRIRESGLVMPPDWRGLIVSTQKKKIIVPAKPLLQFPYIAKARPEHSDILEISALIPRCFPDYERADIVQEIMLCLLEGTVTLDELRRNRNSARFFIKRFMKENFEDGGRAVSLSQQSTTDRSFEDVIQSVSARNWFHDQEAQRSAGSLAGTNLFYTAPTQIDDVFASQVREEHRLRVDEALKFGLEIPTFDDVLLELSNIGERE